jgi:hypothetical protein
MSVEESRSIALYVLFHGELGWVVELSTAPTTQLGRITQFLMNRQDKEACAVEDFCKIWTTNFCLWDSVLLISVSRSCICGSSSEGILHQWCELLVWGLVELENISFGFRSMLLPWCLPDRRLPILILSRWVKQGVWLLFAPSLFLVTGQLWPFYLSKERC